MNDFQSDLLSLYRSNGLHDETGPTYAPTSCIHAKECWSCEPEERIPPTAPPQRGQIYRPWIGSFFERTRIVVIGVNFNDHGGFDQAEEIVRYVIPELNQGKKRMNFGLPRKVYAGSLFQHRAAVYAQVWLSALGEQVSKIGDVYHHIAFTNHVKCSPLETESRSPPNPEMWRHCGTSLLKEELRILGVRRAIIVGMGSNASAFRSNVWTDLKAVVSSGEVSLLRSPSGREALVVPHPASPGRAERSIRNDVVEVLTSASEGRAAPTGQVR